MTALTLAMRVGNVLESYGKGNHDTFTTDPYGTLEMMVKLYYKKENDNKSSIASLLANTEKWKGKTWSEIANEPGFDLLKAEEIVILFENLFG